MARRLKGFDCVPWWLNDWLGSSARAELSPAARMAYCELCWREFSYGAEVTEEEWGSKATSKRGSKRGSKRYSKGLPKGEAELGLLVGMTPNEWSAIAFELLDRFEEEDGRLYNPKVEKEIGYRLAKVYAGSIGGSKRGSKVSKTGVAKGPISGKPSSSSSSSSSKRTPPAPQGDVCGVSASQTRGASTTPTEEAERAWDTFRTLAADQQSIGNPNALVAQLKARGVKHPNQSGYTFWNDRKQTAAKNRKRELITALGKQTGKQTSEGRVDELGLFCDPGFIRWWDMDVETLEGHLEEATK